MEQSQLQMNSQKYEEEKQQLIKQIEILKNDNSQQNSLMQKKYEI